MKELVDILGAAGRAYYQDDSSVMTDYQYDALAQELAALEAQTGVVLAASPSVNVGYSVQSALEKVPHDQPLLSLDKTKDVGRLAAFMGAHKCLLSWKLDGLTVVANYVGGEPVMALTRGNGLVGENITHNALVFRNIPRRISNTAPLSIRGEAVITFADFERVNRGQDDADKYKNPRNLTSGSVRQLNSEIAARRGIMFYAFALTGGGLETDSKEEQLKLLETLGFDVTPYAVVSADTVEDAVEEFRQAAGGLPYATDGLVATYDSIAFSRSLGQTSKFPHDSIAFKWADEAAQTTLTEVSWGTSRTGLINPVAVFEPVELEGSTVRQASLHNISIIEALELGLGDTITVYKANMIIPQVGDNLTRSGGLPIPASCPVCETAAQIRDEHGIKTLFCPNLDCRSRLVRALAHYVSRDAANIEGLSEASIEKFVEAGFLQSYADIYRLKDFEAQITAMDGFGKKSFDKLAASVEKSRTMELASFINALGIPQIGAENAKQLAANLGTPQAIVSATAEELVSIPGFGEKIALSVTAYFADPLNLELLHQTLPLLNLTEPVQPPADGKYSGLNFVITGSINNYANRKQLQAHIEAHGGRVASAVSKATTHLINNDSASASAKNKKARELGVSVITEAEFELL
ncbi:MAG: NAD-dependent DNA ligase LigA [Defluviitaleaceae bacterium]|nr:NAD-dependent DNA ligase LigA [Defluviitaleaceae bacterium]